MKIMGIQLNYLLTLVSLGILISCNKPIKFDKQLPNFDLKNITETSKVNLSELGVQDILYIPLETNNFNLISQIKKIEINNNSYFIADWNKISKYNSDGSFFGTIGIQGRGPQEYNLVIDFSIDTKKNKIFLLNGSRINGKINTYNLNGNFIKSFSSPVNTLNIVCVKNMLLCYLPDVDGNIDTSYVFLDYDGNKIKSYANKYQYNKVNVPRGFSAEFIFYKFKEQTLIKEIYSDTIFSIDSQGFNPAYILNYGKNTLTPEIRGAIKNTEDYNKVFNQTTIVTNLLETQKFIYSEFVYNQQLYSFIYLKEKESCFLVNMEEGIINDIDGGPGIYFKTSKEENYILSWINSVELKAHVATEAFKNSTPKYPEKKKELELLANSLDENDNPVLMLVKLKD